MQSFCQGDKYSEWVYMGVRKHAYVQDGKLVIRTGAAPKPETK